MIVMSQSKRTQNLGSFGPMGPEIQYRGKCHSSIDLCTESKEFQSSVPLLIFNEEFQHDPDL